MTQSSVFNHNYLITTLVARDDQLLVGDALTSVSLLELRGSQIEPIAKDYGSLWPTCAELLDHNTIIGGNVRTVFITAHASDSCRSSRAIIICSPSDSK
jgi:DNA damage-binding protein 1